MNTRYTKNARQPVNYLTFDHSRMINLDFSLNREVIIANQRGSYHASSLAECNTRKQHGLLVVPAPNSLNEKLLLLSSVDETIIQHGAEFNMGINKFDGDNYAPKGHKYIREFNYGKTIRTIYRVGGVVFSKEKVFSTEKNIIYSKYELLDAHSETTLRIRPLLAFRNINNLTFENSSINYKSQDIENGLRMDMYSDYPSLYMQFNINDVKFTDIAYWIKGVEYLHDQMEGYPYKEDLYTPGYFELKFKKGETIILGAAEDLIEIEKMEEDFKKGESARLPQDSFYNCLAVSGRQMILLSDDNKEAYVSEGYPWGNVTARNQFISMDGLTMSINDIETYEKIIDTSIFHIRNFLEKKEDCPKLQGIDEPDVLFWFIRSLSNYFVVNPKSFNEKYREIVKDIISFVLNNDHPHLHITKDYLLRVNRACGNTSWMDGVIDGQPVVQRTGLLVELNAIWYQSLMFALECESLADDEELSQWVTLATENIMPAFERIFLNEHGYLYDYVDYGKVDKAVRPNMLFALSSKYPLFDMQKSKTILDFATKELLNTKGLRTKSPQSNSFFPRIEGTLNEKIFASFNGVARIWLIETYLEAYSRIYKRSAISFIERILAGLEQEMREGCIGTFAQMYDGSVPSWGHGLISSGIDIASILNVMYYKEKFMQHFLETKY